MRLTTELIHESLSYLNPLKERELDLRGHKIPTIENLGAAGPQDCIDFTDNAITHLGNFPLSPRLRTLLLANNRVSSISSKLGESLPGLRCLVLMGNEMRELADLDALASCGRLEVVVLSENPVCRKDNYRLYLIWRCPSIRFLDYTKVRLQERTAATALFGTHAAPSALATQISGLKSRTFDTNGAADTIANGGDGGMNGANGAGSRALRVKLTPAEKKRVEELIRNARSLKEIVALEKQLNEGRVPDGARVEE